MANGSEWFYRLGDGEAAEKHGPLAFAELQGLIRAGKLGREVEVFTAGMPAWQPASQILTLAVPSPVSTVHDPALRMVLPVGRSRYAIAACYLGIFSMVPLCAPPAVVFAVLAIRDLRRHPHKLGWGHIITALVLGVPATLLWTWALLA